MPPVPLLWPPSLLGAASLVAGGAVGLRAEGQGEDSGLWGSGTQTVTQCEGRGQPGTDCWEEVKAPGSSQPTVESQQREAGEAALSLPRQVQCAFTAGKWAARVQAQPSPRPAVSCVSGKTPESVKEP